MHELDFGFIQNSIPMLTTPNLMYIACYFPAIVLILAKTSLWVTIAAIRHVTRVKTSPLIFSGVIFLYLSSSLCISVINISDEMTWRWICSVIFGNDEYMQWDCFSWKRRSPESNCSHQLLRGIIIAPIQSWLRSYFQSIKSNVSSQVSCYITRKTNKDTILSSVCPQGRSTFIQYPSQRRTNVSEENIHEHSQKVNNLCCILIIIALTKVQYTTHWSYREEPKSSF